MPGFLLVSDCFAFSSSFAQSTKSQLGPRTRSVDTTVIASCPHTSTSRLPRPLLSENAIPHRKIEQSHELALQQPHRNLILSLSQWRLLLTEVSSVPLCNRPTSSALLSAPRNHQLQHHLYTLATCPGEATPNERA